MNIARVVKHGTIHLMITSDFSEQDESSLSGTPVDVTITTPLVDEVAYDPGLVIPYLQHNDPDEEVYPGKRDCRYVGDYITHHWVSIYESDTQRVSMGMVIKNSNTNGLVDSSLCKTEGLYHQCIIASGGRVVVRSLLCEGDVSMNRIIHSTYEVIYAVHDGKKLAYVSQTGSLFVCYMTSEDERTVMYHSSEVGVVREFGVVEGVMIVILQKSEHMELRVIGDTGLSDVLSTNVLSVDCLHHL